MLGQQRLEACPLVGRHVAGVDDGLHEGPRLAAGGLQQVDERQRHLAFAQVATHRLAERLGLAGEVEQVVDHLEEHPEVEPVVAQRLPAFHRRLGEHRPDLGAPAEQVGRLAVDDVEVLGLVDVDDAVLRQLVNLALDHAQRHVAEHADDVHRVLREGHRHRLDVEEVARQHRDVVAPLGVHGLAPAPHVGIVDDVVVHQRGRVDELDHRGIEDGLGAGVAAQTGRHQQHGRPHPLAAAALDVSTDLGDHRHLRLDLSRVLVLDCLEIGPDRFEERNQVDVRFGQCVGQVRQSHHTVCASVNEAQDLCSLPESPAVG